jgi:hypothetical protein
MSFAEGLSDRIAAHVATIRFEDLPDSTIAAAAMCCWTRWG